MKAKIEWTIRRKSGATLRRLWTTTEAAGVVAFETAKHCKMIPQNAQLIFERKIVW